MNIPTRTQPFADRVAERSARLETRLVVGLDPQLEFFPTALQALEPEEALVRFSAGVLDAVRDLAVAVKPQIAFFEQYGWRGLRAFQRCVEQAAAWGIPVIADCKRGDIGSTATAYARAFLGDDPQTPGPYVDAVTLSPYLGRDSLAPFVTRAQAAGRGLFVLARTSNPGARDLQDRATDGEPLYLGVARWIEAWSRETLGACGYGPLGLVCGATYPQELAELRAAAPHCLFLVPGLGAQGGKPEDLRLAFDARGYGALPSSSRAILYPWGSMPGPATGWLASIHAAADETRCAIEAAR
ncbi:MAG: orotidine-5'-phosphate decarboxylase [Planctomycetota bacterium]